MPIIRNKPTDNYTIIQNSIINSKTLSLKAKAVLIYLLSKPELWNPNITDIKNHCKESAGTIKYVLKELEKNKYIFKSKNRAEKGRFAGWTYFVFDSPRVVLPTSVIPPYIKTDKDNKTKYTTSVGILQNKFAGNEQKFFFNKFIHQYNYYRGIKHPNLSVKAKNVVIYKINELYDNIIFTEYVNIDEKIKLWFSEDRNSDYKIQHFLAWISGLCYKIEEVL